ncbi:FadR family transcriptional regulator [Arsenicitalea aurantiaca]|uniref:FadR family transcriptional regulator n=1 Tax=Arsenicitalea aurantiaca TaxID=1783274 RepID=A0A433XB29_9HYPH|nr:FadR/GntR family transcriptional regulator [Arsenicitalea aurantiaca]RUT31297.1 FadR family transcriptional regulator [Arsenicitalea aurantiaca]
MADIMRLTDRVKVDLAQLIEMDNLRPGDKLPPAEQLCERFSVSRTVVREAIASLKAEGRLRSRRGSGVFVSEPKRVGGSMFMEAPQDIGEVLELMEFRMSVEIEAAGLAAERRTETNLLRIEQALAQFARRTAGTSLATEADRAFHRAIADATYNRRFRLFVDDMGDRLIPRRALRAGFTDEKDRADFLEAIQAEHRDIFEAVSRREPDRARAAMRAHLEGGRRRYREWSLANDLPLAGANG